MLWSLQQYHLLTETKRKGGGNIRPLLGQLLQVALQGRLVGVPGPLYHMLGLVDGKWVGWERAQEYEKGWTKHVLGPFAKKTRRLVDRFAPRYLTPSQEKSHTRTGVTCYILSPSCLYVGSLSMCSDDRYEAPTREKLGLVTRLGPLDTFPSRSRTWPPVGHRRQAMVAVLPVTVSVHQLMTIEHILKNVVLFSNYCPPSLWLKQFLLT